MLNGKRETWQLTLEDLENIPQTPGVDDRTFAWLINGMHQIPGLKPVSDGLLNEGPEAVRKRNRFANYLSDWVEWGGPKAIEAALQKIAIYKQPTQYPDWDLSFIETQAAEKLITLSKQAMEARAKGYGTGGNGPSQSVSDAEYEKIDSFVADCVRATHLLANSTNEQAKGKFYREVFQADLPGADEFLDLFQHETNSLNPDIAKEAAKRNGRMILQKLQQVRDEQKARSTQFGATLADARGGNLVAEAKAKQLARQKDYISNTVAAMMDGEMGAKRVGIVSVIDQIPELSADQMFGHLLTAASAPPNNPARKAVLDKMKELEWDRPGAQIMPQKVDFIWRELARYKDLVEDLPVLPPTLNAIVQWGSTAKAKEAVDGGADDFVGTAVPLLRRPDLPLLYDDTKDIGKLLVRASSSIGSYGEPVETLMIPLVPALKPEQREPYGKMLKDLIRDQSDEYTTRGGDQYSRPARIAATVMATDPVAMGMDESDLHAIHAGGNFRSFYINISSRLQGKNPELEAKVLRYALMNGAAVKNLQKWSPGALTVLEHPLYRDPDWDENQWKQYSGASVNTYLAFDDDRWGTVPPGIVKRMAEIDNPRVQKAAVTLAVRGLDDDSTRVNNELTGLLGMGTGDIEQHPHDGYLDAITHLAEFGHPEAVANICQFPGLRTMAKSYGKRSFNDSASFDDLIWSRALGGWNSTDPKEKGMLRTLAEFGSPEDRERIFDYGESEGVADIPGLAVKHAGLDEPAYLKGIQSNKPAVLLEAWLNLSQRAENLAGPGSSSGYQHVMDLFKHLTAKEPAFLGMAASQPGWIQHPIALEGILAEPKAHEVLAEKGLQWIPNGEPRAKVADQLAKSPNPNVRIALLKGLRGPEAEKYADVLADDSDEDVARFAVSKLGSSAIWRHRDKANLGKIAVRYGTNKLRILRDAIGKLGRDEATPKEVPPELAQAVGKVGRLPNGNYSAKLLQRAIDEKPATEYGFTYGEWTGAQRHSSDTSQVLQVNPTQDMVNRMREAGVLETFKEFHRNFSGEGGHPVGKGGIGWVRFTGGQPKPDGTSRPVVVEEYQSDFGQRMAKMFENVEETARARGMSEHEIKTLRKRLDSIKASMDKASGGHTDEHLDKINEIIFGGKHSSEMLSEAFHEWARTNRLDVGTKNCPTCGGFQPTCPDCHGQGQPDRITCTECEGSGRVESDELHGSPCPSCKGEGSIVAKVPKTLVGTTVRILGPEIRARMSGWGRELVPKRDKQGKELPPKPALDAKGNPKMRPMRAEELPDQDGCKTCGGSGMKLGVVGPDRPDPACPNCGGAGGVFPCNSCGGISTGDCPDCGGVGRVHYEWAEMDDPDAPGMKVTVFLDPKTKQPMVVPVMDPQMIPKPIPKHGVIGHIEMPKSMGYKPAKYGEVESETGHFVNEQVWTEEVRKAERKIPQLPMHIQEAFDAVCQNLSGESRNGYASSEALYALVGGRAAGWRPMFIPWEGEPHWYLQHTASGTVLDPTAEQFTRTPDYTLGAGKGFLTAEPSKRARELIRRVKEQSKG